MTIRVAILAALCAAAGWPANYSAETTLDGTTPVVRLTDAARHTVVSIAPTVGNIAYEMKVNGKNAFWTPFASLDEFRAKPALCGNPFLAPWANRLDQDAFYANGKRYLLNPALGNLRRDSNGNPIHGLLLYSSAWRVVLLTADSGSASVTSRLEFWKHPDLMAQFPFAHTIEMTYRLREGVLEVETLLRNQSAEPMPVAIGYHPYFRLHDVPRDEWRVHVAARERLELSAELIPTGERRPTGLPDALPLKDTSLDDVFVNLVRDANGRATFRVEGRRESISVVYGPRYTVAVIYAPPGREFICFEPMSAITNAFNLAHSSAYGELQSIPPGGEWRESYWIEPAGF